MSIVIFPLFTSGRALYGASDLHSQHPPLNYKKLSLQEQNKTNDCFVLGTFAPTQFDHLVTASVSGGFQARYKYVLEAIK